jgi:nondiscriminating glutamyl-tRNA synthetase
VLNYLLLLGWDSAGEAPILDRWTMRRRLSLAAFSAAPVTVDRGPLDLLNRHYLQALGDGALASLVHPLLDTEYGEIPAGDRWLVALVQLVRPEMTLLTDCLPLTAWAFGTDIEYTDAARAALNLEDTGLVLVRLIAAIARDAVLLDQETAAHILARLGAQLQHDTRHPAIAAALLGRLDGPDLAAVCALLGRERVLERLAAALRRRSDTAQNPPI